MAFQQLIDSFSWNPKRLFLIDGFGAILSSFLLGVVLVKLENLFGIPIPTRYFLAFLPCTFAVYDFYCFTRVKENVGLFLKCIAYINISYCCISLGLAFYHYNQITYFGWTYVLLEIVLVLALANLELKTANLSAKISSASR